MFLYCRFCFHIDWYRRVFINSISFRAFFDVYGKMAHQDAHVTQRVCLAIVRKKSRFMHDFQTTALGFKTIIKLFPLLKLIQNRHSVNKILFLSSYLSEISFLLTFTITEIKIHQSF